MQLNYPMGETIQEPHANNGPLDIYPHMPGFCHIHKGGLAIQ